MNVSIKMVGVTGMICHNIQLADPLNEYTRAIKEITGKRKKTDADNEAISALEWRGGLYYEAPNGNGTGAGYHCPTMNVKRCFQEGAKISKEGRIIQRAFHPVSDKTPIVFADGGVPPDDLYKQKQFVLRSPVTVSGRGVIMRTRPIFREWALSFDAVILEDMLNLRDLQRIAELSGQVEGLNDGRTIGYGRFNVEIKEVK